MKFKLNRILAVAVIFAAFALSPQAFAEHPEPLDGSGSRHYNTKPQQAPEIKSHTQATKERMEQAAKERQEVKKEKLEGIKLKKCQARERTVTKLMSRIGDRGQKHLDLFTKISERTQKFYMDKGLSLANYDALVADVYSKQSAAQAAVDATKSTTVQFKCDGDNPKATADSFKQSRNSQGEALKAYKTSVKNLIVGVKSLKSAEGVRQ